MGPGNILTMFKNEMFSLWRAGKLQKELSSTRIALADLDFQEPIIKGTKAKDIIKTKECVIDRMKEISFRDENGKHILVRIGQNLAMYIGDLPFENARRVFDLPRLPKWTKEKAIHEDIQIKRLKLYYYLPHQCNKDGKVYDGNKS